MKNLKKVLSLALVFAMVLGLCIGAMAADTQDVTKLTDWDSVTHKDAVTLLNAFNIMQGYPSGNFQPERTVTRAEAVKMIDVALWGGSDQAERFTGSGSSVFSDVKSTDWYAGHVTYAEAYGILDGYPDGTLRPNGTVTGYQMLKMALIALNYDSDVEGLSGAGWDIRTMRLATDPLARYTPSTSTTDFVPNPYDLTAGLEDITNWNAPLTRDQAAQIIYNMIQHSTVTYTLTQNGQTGNVKSYTEKSFGQLVLNMDVKHGTLYANEKGTTAPSGTTIADPTKGNALVQVGTGNPTEVTLDSDLLDLGTNVTLYSKGDVLLGVTLDGWTEVEPIYNATYTAITNEVAADKLKTVTIGSETGAKYSDTIYIDTNGDSIIDLETTIHYAATATVNDVVETEKWGTIYQTGLTTWRNSYEKNSTLHTGFMKADDIGAAKGDTIAYVNTPNVYASTTVNTGVVLTPVEGQVERVTTANGTTSYYIDGVAYTSKDTGVDFGVKGTFYTFPGTNTIVCFEKAKDSTGTTSYALLYDAGYTATGASTAIGGGEGTATMSVAAILPDGTKTTFTVAGYRQDSTQTTVTKLTSSDPITTVLGSSGKLKNLNNHNLNDGTINSNEKNYLVTYYLNDDGNMIITNTNVANKQMNYSANTKIDSTTAKVALTGAETALITSNTVTFIQTSPISATAAEDWTVALGNAATYTVNAASESKIDVFAKSYSETISDLCVAYAIVETKDVVQQTTKESTFYYVIANKGRVDTDTDETPIYEVDIYDASADEVITAKVKSKTYVENGSIYTQMVGTSVVTLTSELTGTKNGYVTSFDSGIISLTKYAAALGTVTETDKGFTGPTTSVYVTDKDTKFFYIDGADSEEIAANEVAVQGEVEPTVEKQTNQNKEFTGLKVTVKYGAMLVVGSDSVVDTVILFASDRSETPVTLNAVSR